MSGMSNTHVMDVDTTPPSVHHDSRPSMQLDLSPDENMMDVDPEIPNPSPAANQNTEPLPVLSGSSMSSPSPFPTMWHHSSSSRGLEAGSTFVHQLSPPPVASITSSNVTSTPMLKLDQLFVEWFVRSDSQNWLRSIMDDSNIGKPSDSSQVDFSPRSSRIDRSLSPGPHRSLNSSQGVVHVSSQSGPGSPVSKLFWNHKPFGDLDSSSRSPSPSSSGASLQLKGGTPPNASSSMDLAHGTALTPVSIGNAAQVPASSNRSSGRTEPQSPKVSREVPDSSSEFQPVPNVSSPTGFNSTETRGSCLISTSEDTSKSNQLENDRTRPTVGVAVGVTDQKFIDSQRSSDTNSEKSIGSENVSADASGFCKNLDGPTASVQPTKNSPEIVFSDRISTSVCDASNSGGFQTKSTVGKSPRDSTSQHSSGLIPPRATSTAYPSGEQSRAQSSKSIPEFYFPCGKDAHYREQKERNSMREYFKAQRTRNNKAGLSRNELAEIVVEVMGLPSYLASIVFNLIMELFPAAGTEASVNAHGDFSESNVRIGSEEAMRDVTGGGEMSSSSSVSSVARASNGEGRWQPDADTAMVDSKAAKDDSDSANGVKDSASSTQSNTGNEISSVEAEKSSELVSEAQMMAFYDARCARQSRESRLFHTLLGGNTDRDYLIPGDFKPLMRALLLSHQGLAFLHVTPEFQQRYSETVIERIYFGCTRQHNGRLSLADLKRSKLLETLLIVDEEEDINRERRFFSYEHFYVLYCRFWELDANHDLQIDREDLLRYGSHSLTTRIVNRIFSGHARPLDASEDGGYMSYTDFIWFCLSEEDKTSDTAIDYWFRCIDLDGDGVITMFDMEYFYREQLHRMESFGHEPVQIKDILCQLLDMINPSMHPPVIRRRDLKRCGLAGNFFNVLFNLNKFFAIEARDPLQIRQEHATPELTDWDRFAALEYLRLSADEEGEEEESWEEVGEPANPLMSGEAPF